jgi:putative ABC transport system permease protein
MQSDLITARSNKNLTISYGSEYGTYQVRGVMPSYFEIEKLVIQQGDGRFINQLDINQTNKVIVLDRKIVEVLFKGKPALGQYVKVGQLMFKVVGINSKKEQWGGSNAYIPFSTSQAIFNPDKKFNQIIFTVNGLETKAANERFDES